MKLVLIIIPSAALSSFIYSISSFVMPLFFSLAIGGSVCVASFVILCWTFGIIDMRAFIVKANAKIKEKLPKFRRKATKAGL